MPLDSLGAPMTSLRWYVAKIETRRLLELDEEGVLQPRKLERFETWLPLVEAWPIRRGVACRTRWPLLPGYLFARLDRDDVVGREMLLEVPGVVDFLRGACNRMTAVPDRQVDMLRGLERQPNAAIPQRIASQWKVGQMAETQHADAWSGLTGRVDEIEEGSQHGDTIVEPIVWVDIGMFAGRRTRLPMRESQLRLADG